jgi:hypothetical protein
MTKPIGLPSKEFKSSKDAREFFKKMLSRYSDGEDIGDEDGQLLYELLQRHPEAKTKMGPLGVQRFFRDKTDMPTSCFYLERHDGTTTDFKIESCITGKPPSIEKEFYDACRSAVADDLATRKREIFEAAGGVKQCATSGENVTFGESEYRHTTPRFIEIVEMFKTAKNIDIRSVSLSMGHDMQYKTSFVDSTLAHEFKIFHAKHAHLDIFRK